MNLPAVSHRFGLLGESTGVPLPVTSSHTSPQVNEETPRETCRCVSVATPLSCSVWTWTSIVPPQVVIPPNPSCCPLRSEAERIQKMFLLVTPSEVYVCVCVCVCYALYVWACVCVCKTEKENQGCIEEDLETASEVGLHQFLWKLLNVASSWCKNTYKTQKFTRS